MRLLWPWGLLSLLAIAAAAVWALRRPMHALVSVGSLRLWEQVLERLGPSARRSRRVTLAWVLLGAGATAAGVALCRPVYLSERPVRRIALAVVPGAELSGLPRGALTDAAGALLARLEAGDRVRLLLPTVLGGATEYMSPSAAARRLEDVRPLPAPAERLSVPEPGGEAEYVIRLAPATVDGGVDPSGRTLFLPACPGKVTIDAFAARDVPSGAVQIFCALRSHSAGRVSGRLEFHRDGDAPVVRRYELAPGQRGRFLVELPGGGQTYWARLPGVAGPGSGAFLVARRFRARRVAMIGRDDVHVRRFLRVCPALRLTGDVDQAEAVVAVGVSPPAGKPALVIDPPSPPPGWRDAGAHAAVALRDAHLRADHPLLANVDLSGVAIRRARGWRRAGAPAAEAIVRVGSDALIVARSGPARVYLGFDLSAENTSFALTESFVIFMANVLEYLVPGGRAEVAYESLTPLEAGPRRRWERLRGIPGEATWPLPAPGVYRDADGVLRAVSLTGLRSADAPRDPRRAASELALPPARPVVQPVELWPALALAATGLWLGGWVWRVR